MDKVTINKKFTKTIEGTHDTLLQAKDAVARALAKLQDTHELHQIIYQHIRYNSPKYNWFLGLLVSKLEVK